MKNKPTYDELLAYTRSLEEKVSLLEGTLRQFQSDGTRVKTRFLSNISHEIRTPMNAIIGFSHLLGEEDVNNKQKAEYIEHITRNSNSLLNLLDNLIDLTLYETGNLQLKNEEVLVYDLLKDLYQTYSIERKRSGIEKVTLMLNVRDSLRTVRIVSDGQRLSRVLGSLIGNALALKNKGVIEIGATFIDKNHILFSVKEDSNRMVLDRARKVFENDDSVEDWYNSTDAIGLGFKLARGLVEKMGGEIRLEDNVLNGATIGLVLPVSVVPEKSRTTKTADSNSTGTLKMQN